mgnify:CR=1 FL=1
MRLARLTSRPAQFLATIQIAITLSGFLGSAFAADNFSDPLVAMLVDAGVPIPAKTLNTIAVVVITLVLSYITLVFGELVPKRLAMKKADTLALGLSGLISTLSTICAPVVAVLTASTNGILRLLGVDPSADEDEVSEEEIKMMVDRGNEKGVFDSATKEFIQNVFEFDDLTVGEFATHRTELDLLWTAQTTEEWRQIIFETRHTRYPVCDGSVDRVVGILDSRDFFRMQDRPLEEILDSVVKPAFFVPETIKADVLFQQMKQRRTYYAVVLDEYGGFFGVVTLKDLLEQLVGEFQQEGNCRRSRPWTTASGASKAPPPWTTWPKSWEWNCPKRSTTPSADMCLTSTAPSPQDGRKITLQTDQLQIQMVHIQDHRLEEALVTVLPKKEDEAKEKDRG